MPATLLASPMLLDELLQGFATAPSVPVSGLASDTRLLGKGDLFLACGGLNSHGVDYIDAAVRAGAIAVAFDSSTSDAPQICNEVPVIPVPNLARHMGEIANRFYASPTQSVGIIGITGTNGKTTVAWLIAQCLERLGRPCAYIGTLGVGLGEIQTEANMTTPGTVELHERLANFRNDGAIFAALEVSSHALDQKRVDGINFDTALFTNLSRDHLDYHGDMESYAEAKATLFTDYPATHRIINIDSKFGKQLASRCGQETVTVSTQFDRVADERPFVFVRSVVAGSTGSQLKISSSWGEGQIALPLPGAFNVANAAIVLAFLLVHGNPIEEACAVLADVSAPPGRMQRVPGAEHKPLVYVDYAHTPAALDAALEALRAHCQGKLWCIFGCGGERDRGKRPLMGQVAERGADHVVITSDNPRGEAPDSIIADIVAGLEVADRAIVIAERAAAIAWAIDKAHPQDVILIAGKGHENYQLIGEERRRFSDFGVALAHLNAKAGAGR